MKASPEEVEADIVYQVGAVLAFARAHGVPLVHVKPHGALYNQAARDEGLSRAIARGVVRVDPRLVFVGLASSAPMRRAAEAEGLRYAAEAFVDRAYSGDGHLVPRSVAGSVFADAERAAAQALEIARDGRVTAADGTRIALRADTLCLHGDNPHSVAIARAVRGALEGAGVQIAPVAD